MNIQQIQRALLLTCSMALVQGCAHSPPEELVDARTAYKRASDGPAKKYTPAALHVASESLDVAERSFARADDPGLVRDLAYIAMRKVEIAESSARTAMYELGILASTSEEERLEDASAKKTKAELAAAQQALGDQRNAGAVSAMALANERQLRAQADSQRDAAELRAANARAELARLASVVPDADGGMVITLSGSVLFQSGRYVLLPSAQAKLSQVAEALLAGDPAATFVVNGFTDSQGKSETNQTLSDNRARAVRDYLIAHEIAADRISARGYGEERMVASNDTAEGRANNRRVEIVVSNPKSGQRSP